MLSPVSSVRFRELSHWFRPSAVSTFTITTVDLSKFTILALLHQSSDREELDYCISVAFRGLFDLQNPSTYLPRVHRADEVMLPLALALFRFGKRIAFITSHPRSRPHLSRLRRI